MSFGSKWRGKSKAVSASLWGLTASSNIKLAWARDKAQFMFTSPHGEINIAAASQFPLARLLLSSYLALFCCHPRCLKEQSTHTACPSKIFTQYWLNTKAILLPPLRSTIQTNYASTWNCRLHLLLFSLRLSLDRARPHTFVYCRTSSFAFLSMSNWFVP